MRTENPNLNAKIDVALTELAQLLKDIGLWSLDPPSTTALASCEPFACDSMNLEAWLQWIFIPRIKTMLGTHQPLPIGCNISAYAEETLGKLPNSVPLLAHIRYIDQLLSAPQPAL